MGSFSIWHWLIVLLIVVLIFGTKKLKNIGADLGGAVKGFKDGVKDGTARPPSRPPPPQQVGARRRSGRRQHGRRRGQDQVADADPACRSAPRMIDFGFDKIALIGAVALIVIGPEKLPRVARTVGHCIGKAQRYVADVKAEVNRSIELDELKKMKTEFEDAARDVEQTVYQRDPADRERARQRLEAARRTPVPRRGQRRRLTPPPRRSTSTRRRTGA